jgi:hypothetical protein
MNDKPFPMPPGTNRSQTVEQAGEQPAAIPPPSLDRKPRGITDDETLFIMKTELREDQFRDPKCLEFILAYMECRNIAQAAREVGLEYWRASTWRRQPQVHACIEALNAKAVMKYGYDVNDVVERVKEISEFDPVVFENPDGSYKTSMTQIPAEARRAIKKFKVKNIIEDDPNGMPRVRGQIIEVELWDKMEAHRLLAREKGTFKETKKIEHDVTANMKDVLLGSQKRAEERALAASRDVGPALTGKVLNEHESGEEN